MAKLHSIEAKNSEHRAVPGMDFEKCGVVQLSRFPQNIADMLNRFLSGDVMSLHMIGTTKDGKVISTSSAGMLDEIRRNDTF